jgi:hypothetical protein
LVNCAAHDPSLLDGLVSIGNPLRLEVAEKKVEQSWGAKNIYLPVMIEGRKKKMNKETLPKPSNRLSLYEIDQLIYNLKTE